MRGWLAAGAVTVVAVLSAPVAFLLVFSGGAQGSCDPIVDAPAGDYTQAQITALWVASGGSTGDTLVSGFGAVPDPVIAESYARSRPAVYRTRR